MRDMKLTEYLDQPNQTATALAAKVGCEVSTITRLAKGERSPSIDLALRIERATNGDVTISDLALVSASDPSEAA
jgi:plasmid maintenance system antidote protein VapI